MRAPPAAGGGAGAGAAGAALPALAALPAPAALAALVALAALAALAGLAVLQRRRARGQGAPEEAGGQSGARGTGHKGGGGRRTAARGGAALAALALGGWLAGLGPRALREPPAAPWSRGRGSSWRPPSAGCVFSGELLGAYGGAGASAWRPPLDPWGGGGGRERAGALFFQGLVLRFGFNLAEARRSFAAALAADPGCSLCAWGLAASFGPTINEGIDEAGRRAAAEAARRASVLARGPAEAALAGLALARFVPAAGEGGGGGGGLQGSSGGAAAPELSPAEAFAEAAAAVARRFPGDATMAALEAEAWMGTSPWRYYAEGAPKSLDSLRPGGPRRALQAVDRALALDAEHPLALHLLIHLLEQLPGGGGPRCRTAADALLRQGQDSHLVHMAGHHFLRSGDYALAVEANQRAMALDAGLFERCLTPYVPGHNVASLMWAAMLSGRPELALRHATPAEELSALAPVLQSVWPYPRALVAVRFGRWDEARSEAARVGARAHPFARVCAEYAAALAAAAGCGDGREAEAARRLDALRAAAVELPEDGEGEFVRGSPFFLEARTLAEMAALTVEARLDLLADPRSQAAAPGGCPGRLGEAGAPSAELAAAAARLERAVALQDGLEYMEPERWYLPLRVCLAAVHLAAGAPARAAAVLERELLDHPRSADAARGLARAARAGAGAAAPPAPPLCPELFG